MRATDREAQRLTSLLLLMGLLLRIGVSVWNGYFGPSFGAEDDAFAFHQFASDLASGWDDPRAFTTGWIYPSLLGFAYRITAPSLFFGGLLSCLAWLISAVAVIRICRVVAMDHRSTVWVAAIYSFIPSSFLITAVTLREAYQMLFVNLLLLAGVHFIHRFRLRYALLFALSAYAAAWLHAALAAFGLLAAIIFVVAKMIYRRMRFGALIVIAGTITFAFLGAAMVVGYDLSFSLSELVTLFRAGTPEDARTNYPAPMVFSSDWDLIANLPLMLTQYLFEPMPWRIGGFADLYLFFENVGRLALIFVALRHALRRRPFHADLFALTVCYFGLEAIWAMGTVNWGTASRHHLPMLGCLLVIGLARKDRMALPQDARAAARAGASRSRSASPT